MSKASRRLSRRNNDIECLFGFRSKKFTGISYVFTGLAGAFITILFYLILFLIRQKTGENPWIDMFFHGGSGNRSSLPYYTLFFGFWTIAALLVKWQKLSCQRKALALKLDIVNKPDFVLTCATARNILSLIHDQTDNPRDFILFDRMERALTNLKNLGNVGAVAECLNTQANNDEEYLANSYTILKGFIWAIPVLGFIGTVLGLSQAIGDFGSVVKGMSGTPDLGKLISSLGNVTGGLSIAFETTLIALVTALIVQLLMTFVINKEELFLDECSNFCHKFIISKIKSVDLSSDEE